MNPIGKRCMRGTIEIYKGNFVIIFKGFGTVLPLFSNRLKTDKNNPLYAMILNFINIICISHLPRY
ncbi:hypothetical protein DHD05_19265 [Arenibacter sp. N53]|nr:hypothetical protein [Arenibacter sp. N53]